MQYDKKNFVGVRIVKIISETKKWRRGQRPRAGFKRVMAIVRINGVEHTRHGDTKDGQFMIMKGAPREV